MCFAQTRNRVILRLSSLRVSSPPIQRPSSLARLQCTTAPVLPQYSSHIPRSVGLSRCTSGATQAVGYNAIAVETRQKSTMTTSSSSAAPQLPAFLSQSKSDIHAKFVDLEWQQRNRLLQGAAQTNNVPTYPSRWSRLSPSIVSARNRYLNVEPFAQNRVKLRVAAGENDYINASPIVLGKRKYIATQGPKESSVNHFYRMLASEIRSPIVVVMLTQTHEGGREKCFQYYPLSSERSPLVIPPDEDIADGFSGEVVLHSVNNDSRSKIEVRKLCLRTSTSKGAVEEKDIHHLLFSGWPDFLVPEGDDRNALLELVRLSAALNRPSSSNTSAPHHTSIDHYPGGETNLAADLANTDQDNARIIHCSAGVGRSGTFIALDYLLSLMFAGELDRIPASRDPIAETVDLLRQQRMMMVQGESQFMFLYEVLREQMSKRLAAGQAATG